MIPRKRPCSSPLKDICAETGRKDCTGLFEMDRMTSSLYGTSDLNSSTLTVSYFGFLCCESLLSAMGYMMSSISTVVLQFVVGETAPTLLSAIRQELDFFEVFFCVLSIRCASRSLWTTPSSSIAMSMAVLYCKRTRFESCYDSSCSSIRRSSSGSSLSFFTSFES